MYNRILVAIDGSETARTGLGEAVKLARSLQSRMRLLHVVNKTPWAASDINGFVWQRLLDDLRSSGECILHDAAAMARAAGVEADTRLIEAPGAEAGDHIVSEASAWPADLIVCGTHGRRGIRRLLMGSDAEHVVRHSPVPVLLVRSA